MLEFFNGAEYEDLYEFSTSVLENPFGVELMRTSMEIYNDIDEAVVELVKGLNLNGIEASEDDIIGLMTGEYLPSPECLEALEALYYDEEDNFYDADYERLISSAEAAENLAYQTAVQLGMIEDDDAEFYEDEDEEDEYEEDEYEEDEDPRISELQNQLSSQQERLDTTDALDELTEYASHLVQEGKLPPVAFNFMLGDRQNTSNSRYAEFSAYCEESQVPLAQQLDRIQYVLDVFSQCGPVVNFSQVVKDEVGSDAIVSKDEAALIQSMFKSYKTK